MSACLVPPFAPAAPFARPRARPASIADVGGGASGPVTLFAYVCRLALRWPRVALTALAAAVLLPGIGRPLADTDEGRHAEIPRAMLAAGDLVAPRFAGQVYFEKPPLQYWLTAAVYAAAGARPWAARLVPVFAAWLTVLVSYGWARRALGRRPALLGACALCLTPGFVALGQTVVLDGLLAGCVAGAWYAGQRALRDSLQWRWWLLSATCAGLGVLTKGPVALALALPPLFAFASIARQPSRLWVGAWAAYLGLALIVAGPWYVAMGLRVPGYLTHFFWHCNVVRFVAPYDHQQPWWFYMPVLLVGTLPWSLLAPALGWLAMRHRERCPLRTPGALFCILAAGWCFAFLSLSGCKSPPYLAPALSPLALLAGACLDAVARRGVGAGRLARWTRSEMPRRTTAVVLVVALGGCATARAFGWLPIPRLTVEVLLAGGGLVAWWCWRRRPEPAAAWAGCAAAVLMLLAGPTRDLAAGFAARHSLEAAARAALKWHRGATCSVVSYERTWLSATFYFQRERVPCFDKGYRADLIAFLVREPAAMVLVEEGPPLADLIRALPETFARRVYHPERPGQAALVAVWHPGTQWPGSPRHSRHAAASQVALVRP